MHSNFQSCLTLFLLYRNEIKAPNLKLNIPPLNKSVGSLSHNRNTKRREKELEIRRFLQIAAAPESTPLLTPIRRPHPPPSLGAVAAAASPLRRSRLHQKQPRFHPN